MNTSETITKIAPALVSIQSYMVAIKDADNPFFKSKYAPLDEILKTIRPALENNELTIIQSMETIDRLMCCTTRIIHASGEWIDSTLSLAVEKSTPQGFGSAASYVRRYGLCAALSISTPNEDDDANKAEEDGEKAKVKAAEAKKLEAYNKKVDAQKEAWRGGLLELSKQAVTEAFEASGYTSDAEDPDSWIDELLGQVTNFTKLKNIKELAKKRHDAANKEQK